jgi:ABC-type transport system involved in multi-copper enzyme maturation permease subunit
MNPLIKTEWLKIKRYRAFWWLTGITALSYPGINTIFYNVYKELVEKQSAAGKMARQYLGQPFAFPEAWHTVAYFSSWFVFIPSVVIIMFITNEYTFKTHRQNIIDGWSRNQFLAGKMANVLITSLVITLLCFSVALVTGILNTEKETVPMWSKLHYIGLFALQTFSQLSIAFLFGFLIRKAFIALGAFLFYCIIFEPILVAYLREKANDEGKWLPLEISDRLIPVPSFLGKLDQEAYQRSLANINEHIIYTILLTTLIWAICFRVNNRRDL